MGLGGAKGKRRLVINTSDEDSSSAKSGSNSCVITTDHEQLDRDRSEEEDQKKSAGEHRNKNRLKSKAQENSDSSSHSITSADPVQANQTEQSDHEMNSSSSPARDKTSTPYSGRNMLLTSPGSGISPVGNVADGARLIMSTKPPKNVPRVPKPQPDKPTQPSPSRATRSQALDKPNENNKELSGSNDSSTSALATSAVRRPKPAPKSVQERRLAKKSQSALPMESFKKPPPKPSATVTGQELTRSEDDTGTTEPPSHTSDDGPEATGGSCISENTVPNPPPPVSSVSNEGFVGRTLERLGLVANQQPSQNPGVKSADHTQREPLIEKQPPKKATRQAPANEGDEKPQRRVTRGSSNQAAAVMKLSSPKRKRRGQPKQVDKTKCDVNSRPEAEPVTSKGDPKSSRVEGGAHQSAFGALPESPPGPDPVIREVKATGRGKRKGITPTGPVRETRASKRLKSAALDDPVENLIPIPAEMEQGPGVLSDHEEATPVAPPVPTSKQKRRRFSIKSDLRESIPRSAKKPSTPVVTKKTSKRQPSQVNLSVEPSTSEVATTSRPQVSSLTSSLMPPSQIKGPSRSRASYFSATHHPSTSKKTKRNPTPTRYTGRDVFGNYHMMSSEQIRDLLDKEQPSHGLGEAQVARVRAKVNHFLEDFFDTLCENTDQPKGFVPFSQLLALLDQQHLVREDCTPEELMRSMKKRFSSKDWKENEGVLFPSRASSNFDTDLYFVQ